MFAEYKEPETISYTEIRILPFLIGTEWDQRAMNYIHAVQPSKVVVTYGKTTMNSVTNRVTVYLNDDNVIEDILQEVEVGCDGFDDAEEMDSSFYNYGGV